MLHRTIEDRLEEIENEVHDIKTMLLQYLTIKPGKSPEVKDTGYMSVKDVAAFAGVDNICGLHERTDSLHKNWETLQVQTRRCYKLAGRG
jgi:hypothetical protein